MKFVVTEMAQWLEHQTLGNIIELGFLGCGFDTTKTLEFIFFSYRLLKYSKLNIVRNCAFVNL